MRSYILSLAAAAILTTTAHAQDAGTAAAMQAQQTMQMIQTQQQIQQDQLTQQQILINQQMNAQATASSTVPCVREVCIVATPTPSLAKGTITAPQFVALTSRSKDAIIFYTTDGSIPTRASRQYTQPISITATTKLRAIAVVPTYAYSRVMSVTYKFK